MKLFELNGCIREQLGKKAAKALRKQDMVPCNLYGLGEQMTFTVTVDAVRKLIYTPDTLAVSLTIGEKKTMAVVKEMQFHPLSGNILHIDFLAVDENNPITINVPVSISGHAVGVQQGGKFFQSARALKVSAVMKNLPDELPVDISALGLDKVIKAGDLKFDNVTIVTPKSSVVCGVKSTRNSIASAEDSSEAAE